METLAEQPADETGYPGSWIFGEHGELVAGTFVGFDEAPTKDYGMKVLLILDVDGQKRSIWLTTTALFNRVRDELSRRTSKRLDPGERVVIERHAKKKSKDGRDYWPFFIAFPDRPEKSTTDLFDLDKGPVGLREKGDDGAVAGRRRRRWGHPLLSSVSTR